MCFYRIVITLIAFYTATAIATEATKDYIKIVGSSTAAPFIIKVANSLSKQDKISPPDMIITGTGLGFQKFCTSNSEKSPDITGASRRIKTNELRQCQTHGIDVYELMFGFDGIVIADHYNSKISLSKKQLFLALAAKVPDSSGDSLMNNPYHYWNEIDATLPHRSIKILGGPKSSGTYDTIKHKLIIAVSKFLPAYEGLKYDKIRDDGVYINDHEDHNNAVKVLQKDQQALAIFGYSYYVKHMRELTAVAINGYHPTEEDITTMKYPLARPLYMYIKMFHLKTDPDMLIFINKFLSDETIAFGGLLQMMGLVPLPDSIIMASRLSLKYLKPLSLAELSKKY